MINHHAIEQHPYLREDVAPSAYWLVEPATPEARERLDDLLLDRCSYTLDLLREGSDPRVHALAVALTDEELAKDECELANVCALRLLRVQALYPIEMNAAAVGRLSSMLNSLPGADAGTLGFFRGALPTLGACDEPGLDVTLESTGLNVFGLLPRRQWSLWRQALLTHLADWPLRSTR